jgi:hypothetical protein
LKIILTCIFLACSFCVTAQSSFYKISLGGGAGITRSYADLPEKNNAVAVYGTVDYLFTPFISLGLEVQQGQVKGGQNKVDPYGRRFANDYRSVTINGKLALGNLVDYKNNVWFNHLKGLYVGSGFGFIQNRVNQLDRGIENAPDQLYIPFTKEPVIPLNIGMNYFFPDRYGQYRYVANINIQSNITIGEGLDGYDSTIATFRNGKPDIFSFFSLGIKYNFGPEGVSQKTFKKY